jgi:hypothetical protein
MLHRGITLIVGVVFWGVGCNVKFMIKRSDPIGLNINSVINILNYG